jgi:hypothetical protein
MTWEYRSPPPKSRRTNTYKRHCDAMRGFAGGTYLC